MAPYIIACVQASDNAGRYRIHSLCSANNYAGMRKLSVFIEWSVFALCLFEFPWINSLYYRIAWQFPVWLYSIAVVVVLLFRYDDGLIEYYNRSLMDGFVCEKGY